MMGTDKQGLQGLFEVFNSNEIFVYVHTVELLLTAPQQSSN